LNGASVITWAWERPKTMAENSPRECMDHPGRIFQYGLTTYISRFFDSDFDFLTRGLVFIALGAGFLYMNFRMMRKSAEKK